MGVGGSLCLITFLFGGIARWDRGAHNEEGLFAMLRGRDWLNKKTLCFFFEQGEPTLALTHSVVIFSVNQNKKAKTKTSHLVAYPNVQVVKVPTDLAFEHWHCRCTAERGAH